MNTEYFNLKKKVKNYQEVLSNTQSYRAAWENELKDFIVNQLTEITAAVGLDAKIETKSKLQNLEAIVLSLGDVESGMYQKVNESFQRHLIKHNGSLIYQQLFNGKIIVIINYPFIENYGQPHPPKTIGIYRPEELKTPFCVRHLEEFVNEITNWEDYDDDEPNKKIGFQFNFGLNKEQASEPVMKDEK